MNSIAEIEHIPENVAIKSYLFRLIEQQIVPSSLLFAGPKSAQKEAFALSFAKAILGVKKEFELDLYQLKPEGKVGMHSIDSIRSMRSEVYLPPYASNKKVFLINEAERMLPYSANALLKTLEEPPSYSVIVLISSFPSKLLPTILSRCRTLYFKAGNSVLMESHIPLIRFLSRRSVVSYLDLVRFAKQLTEEIETGGKDDTHAEKKKDLTAYQLQQLEKQREGVFAMHALTSAEELFEQILGWFRDMHLLQCNGPIKALFHTKHQEEVEQACQRGEFASLEYVQKAIGEAKLSLERSTPLHHVFENLLLKITFLDAKHAS